jgi:hypothetical protein
VDEPFISLLDRAGEWTHRDRHQHHDFRLDVPERTVELRLRFRWAPHDMGSEHLANSASLYLFGPDGLRGAMHRTDDDRWTVIGETTASPGCLPGPIAAGPWVLTVDTGLILNDGAQAGQLAWHIEASARLGDPAGEPAPMASPALAPPGVAGAGWYRGDLHSHTVHSDGTFTVDERLRVAVERGLDFIAVTDHNTVSHHRELAAWRGPVVPIRGSEVTTFHGHMNVFGLTRAIDWRAERRGGGAAGIVEQAHRQGALVSINHPSSFGDPWCVGCHWDYARVDYSTFDTMEVWNGGWADVETANEGNIAFWTDLLDAGVRLTAIAGTDSHGPVDDDDASLGFTYVHATERSEAAILDGIRLGRVFLSRGPRLTFRATGSDGAEVRLPGGELAGDGSMRLTVDVEGLDRAATLWFATSAGSKVSLASCGPAATRIVDDVPLVAARWWRLELRAGAVATGDLLVLTNPVHVVPGGAASERDRQRLERPIGRGLDADDRTADRVGRDPTEELLEGDPGLEPRERGPEAVVDAFPEGDMPLRVAREVQPVRLRPMPLVTIGRRPHERDASALGDHRAVHPDVAGGRPRQHLDRRVEPEQFLDRGRRDRRLGTQHLPLVGESIEVQQRVRDEPGRGRDPGDEQEHGAAEHLVGAQLARLFRGDEVRHEVLARRAAPLGGGVLHVRPEPVAARDRLGGQGGFTGIALEHGAEPVEQLRVIGLRKAEPGEHRRSRQRPREVPGEVGLPGVREGVDQLDDLPADDRLEPAAERGRAEREAQRPPEARVNRRIHPGEVAGREEQLIGVVDVVAAPASARREGLPVPRGGLHVVEPRQDPEVQPSLVVDGRFVAEAPVGRIRIIERDEGVPIVIVHVGDEAHRDIEPKLNHSSQPWPARPRAGR